MGELGEIIRRLKNKRMDLVLEFVDHFNWEVGDFKDDDSCFWKERSLAKKALLENGATPLLIRDKSEKKIGRAIVINRKDHLVVFNAYGLNLEEVSSILAKYFHCKYKIVSTKNEDFDPDELVFINKDKAGIISQNSIEDNFYVLGIKASDYRCCEHCKRYFHVSKMEKISSTYYCYKSPKIFDAFICNKCIFAYKYF